MDKIKKIITDTFICITTGEETTLTFTGVIMCIILSLFLPFEIIKVKRLERKERKEAQKEEKEQYKKYIEEEQWKIQHDL